MKILVLKALCYKTLWFFYSFTCILVVKHYFTCPDFFIFI